MAGNNIKIALKREFLTISIILFLNLSGFSQGLIVSAGTKFAADAGNIVLKGSLVNDGSFTNNTSTLVFSGTTQSLAGGNPIVFNNLTVASGSTTTITTAGQSLRRILLSNGTLNSNGNITLLSTAAQTALIDGTGSGQVAGNVTMRRYFPSGFGYKYFSSPFQGAKVSEFGDDMNLSAPFPPIYRYNEDRVSSGWINYTFPDSVLKPLHGYTINFGSSHADTTADVSGVVNNGALSITLYNHNRAYTKGFNLVGNPYPSPIDWNAASGWTKTNINNALYYFKSGVTDQYTGTYSTYINGVSSDGLATNTIPSMQAFFIHVSDLAYPVTGTLAMNNSVRISDLSHNFLKSAAVGTLSFLRLTACFTDYQETADPIVIYFDEKAFKEFDSGLDALKLLNTDILVPNLYAVTPDGYKLSIDALPLYSDSLLIVPLGIKTARNGILTFRIRDTANLQSGTRIYLDDSGTGVNQVLSNGKDYSTYLGAGEYNTRFSLRFVNITTDIPGIIPKVSQFSIYSTNGILIADFNLVSGNRGTLIIYNISGQILFRKEIYTGGYQEFDPQLKSGIYFVTYLSGKTRETKKIFILSK